MQELTPSPIKRDDIEVSKLIIGIRATMDPFLTDFRVEKLYCISQVRRYLGILQGAF